MRTSRKHLLSTAYGTLADLAWNQSTPWKLSDADINELAAKSSRTNPFRFYCDEPKETGTAPTNEYQAQFFSAGCSFSASAVTSGHCLQWYDGAEATSGPASVGDGNSCGLGSHLSSQSQVASYGWHSCGHNVLAEDEYHTPDHRTGCGNNYNNRVTQAGGSAGRIPGNGHLWVG